ncbi:hypothetical protein [Quadrisphaera sp. INWT6]|uniref:hypothetical protein n=1 Tax=Quadrisphaera sp. INWT6 TaxID=2596917 RepID=UPI0018921A77|nr:hypothetical protein [Quadrisphaera sp. INWT6]MBF5081393.1 hypothetical protein [Quadrisphaera sp. INWT6]
MTLSSVIDWINTDRIGAIGDGATALAFVLGFAVYLHDRLDKRRAQAEQVAAWLSLDEHGNGRARYRRWYSHVSNGSTQPVREVLYIAARGAVEAQYIDVLPPGAAEVTPVGEEIAGHLEGEYAGGITLDFTDAAGRRWRRTSRGKLRRWHRWDGQPSNNDVRRRLRASRRTVSEPPAAEGQQDGAETRTGDGG